MADHKMDWRTFSEPGITGDDYDRTHRDLKNLKRIEQSWAEDEFGAKLSLGANYGDLLQDHMGVGDVEMMTNGEAVDPPRDDPAPGSYEFGERARERRERLRRRHRDDYRPEDPNDAYSTDVISGKKTSLKKRRQDLEDAGNF